MADLSTKLSSHSVRLLLSLSAGALALLASAPIARAHISVDEGGTHKSRYSDAGLKDGPCGMTGGKRGTNVYEYKPGATINISIMETIPHPGYFRISFDSDGDDGFVTPSGTDGAMGNCSGDAKCGAGKADYCNSPTVLLDNLDPHAGGFGGGAKKWTWSVKLPDVECDNCTIQIIQVMNDLNYHPQPYPGDDIYYQCIDIKLSKSAPDVSDAPVTNKGMVCNAAPPAGGTGGMGGAAGAAEQPSAAGAAGSTTAGAAAGPVAGMPPASSQAGAGGTSQSSSAGAPSTTAGRPSVPTSSGGAGAAAPVATAGSGTGTTTGAVTGAGTAAPVPAADSGGGCSAAAGVADTSPVWPLSFVAAALTYLRRRRRPRKPQHIGG
ncbi:MAG TPA: SCE4755 family polysaccharide monooxygenase-like protein [Polyangiales bacterium]|nr:SCE4755 family polysaccharide monooxygenase-like protein [Polyangiales bacterium]